MDSPLGTGHLTTEELFRQHAGFVARFLARLGVPSEQLEDALQEVFLVAHRNGGYRPGIAKPTSYLANIAIRAAAQHRRRDGVARQRHSAAPVEQMPGEIEDPARALQVQQDLQRLQRALERLPEDLRTTLVLVELEGESCVSVAAGLGCPVGTIYWRLHQARKQLQSVLKGADVPRRSARAAPERGERVQPARSFMVLFGLDGFRRSEASRLLQLAREQPSSRIALDDLFNRHQQLVQSGAELPTWANSFVPHASSWLTLLGPSPITAGAIAGAGILAAVILTTYLAPPAQPDEPPRAPPTADVDAPSEPIATAASDKPAPEAPSAVQSSIPSETPRAKIARDRQPRAAQPRAQGAPTSSTSTSTSRETTDLRPDGVRARADTAAPASPAPAAADRRADEGATPAPEPPPPQAVQKKSSTAPDLELAEMREIKRAESLLSDDPQRALELTRSMQAGFPDGHFREERAYLEVMALLELGRTREMREKAAAFLRGYPTGLYSSRVRKAVAGKAN